MRDIEPTNCGNLDAAIRIATHPHANPQEQAFAGSYIASFVGSHAVLVVGAGVLSWQAIAAGSGVVTAMLGGTQVLNAAQTQLLRLEVAAVAVGAGYIPNIFFSAAGDGSGDPSGERPESGKFRGLAAKGFDWEHIIDHHAPWGSVAKQRKAQGVDNSIFENMTETQIKASVKEAWRNRTRIRSQADPRTGVTRVVYSGRDSVSGYTIEMWYNQNTKFVETAFPLR